MIRQLQIDSRSRSEFINITPQVEKVVREAGMDEGICFIFTPHTTAALTINEDADPDVVKDINRFLSKIIPATGGYSHTEGNSDAHIKSSIVGCSVSVIIESAQLKLGTWQGIYFCEFDGPRRRYVIVRA